MFDPESVVGTLSSLSGSGQHEVGAAGRLAAHRRVRERDSADCGGGCGTGTGMTPGGYFGKQNVMRVNASCMDDFES